MLFVGLGNPGQEYAKTRHNVGFLAVSEIANRFNLTFSLKTKYKSEIAEGEINANKVILQKPLAYMNNSGVAVNELTKFYKIPIEHVIVFHDDLDLPVGKIKIKQGGGNGGHNGLRSIDQHVGNNYFRVRIGIGHPGHRDQVSGYVLNNFRKEEIEVIDNLLYHLSKLGNLLAEGNISDFTNKLALNLK